MSEEKFYARDYLDEHNRLAIPLVVELLEQEFQFITTKGLETLYVYHKDQGFWKSDANTVIKSFLEERFRNYLSTHTVNEIIEHIRRRKYIELDGFNSEEDCVNLKNGVFDLDKGLIYPHHPDYHFTYFLPFDYDKEKAPEKFGDFLKDISNGDVAFMVSILEGFAYTLMPGYPIQRAFMLTGVGGNGKGTLLNVLNAFVGEQNAAHLKIQSISREHNFVIANLVGKLINSGGDLPSQPLWDVGNFKQLTGGDPFDAEVKHGQQPIRFTNSAKMWFSANTIPESKEDSRAFYRRWHIIEFKKIYGEGKNILPELTTPEELSGIFNVCAFLYPHLKKNLRFTYSQDYDAVRKAYFRSADTLQLWIDAEVNYNPDADQPKESIYLAYANFCEKAKVRAIDRNAFWRRLKDKIEFGWHQHEGMRWITGILIKPLDFEVDGNQLKLEKQDKQGFDPILLYGKENSLYIGKYLLNLLTLPNPLLESEPETKKILETETLPKVPEPPAGGLCELCGRNPSAVWVSVNGGLRAVCLDCKEVPPK